MKKFSLLIIVFAMCSPLIAQKQGMDLIDSLKSKLNDTPADTGKVRLLGKLSFQYFRYDTDLGIYYAGQAIQLAEKLNWKLGEAFSNNYMGINYAVKSNYPKAIEYFGKSLLLYTEIGDKKGIGFISNNLGNFYRLIKEYPKAIEAFDRATRISIEINNKLDETKCYNNLGVTFAEMMELKKSNEYYYKALRKAKQIGNRELESQILINLAENKLAAREYCEALETSLDAIKISNALNLTYEQAVYDKTVGEIYLKIAEENPSRLKKCVYYSNDKTGSLKSAKAYLLNSIKLLERIQDISVLSDANRLLAQVYEKLGDPGGALKAFKQYSSLKDSALSKDSRLKIAQLEKENEIGLKDYQIKIQSLELEKRQTQINLFILAFASIITLTTLILYVLYKRNEKKKDIAADIERQQAAEDLRRSEEKFRLAIEATSDGVWDRDVTLNKMYLSPGFFSALGFDTAHTDDEDVDWKDIIHPEDLKEIIDAYLECRDNRKQSIRVEYRMKDVNGEWRWMLLRGKAVERDPNGNALRMIGTHVDIAESKKNVTELELYRNDLELLVKQRTRELDHANSHLRQIIERGKEYELMLRKSLEREIELNEMKSRFVATTSHEFRTPLTSMFSSIELIQRYSDKWSPDKKNDHYERIKDSIRYLTKLLDDILTLSKSESGDISFAPAPTDLTALAGECVSDALSLTNNHSINLQLSTDSIKYTVDPKLIRFILNNLLSNAIKYSPDGGTVDFNLSSDGEFVMIKVLDKGIGIPDDEIDNIFDSFYRSRNVNTIEGTGLGLSIVKRAVDLHSGDITVSSKLNQGSLFTVRIPLAK